MATRARIKRTSPDMIKQAALSIGAKPERLATALWKTLNPISIILEGVTSDIFAAVRPIACSDLIISLAMDGPFLSSHKKKPLKVRKRNISPKNSAIEERRKISGMNCHTMLIPTRYINSVVA